MKTLNTLSRMAFLLGMFLITFQNSSYAQTTYADTLNCIDGTPTFVVDLSSDPDSLWVSTPAERAGSCCSGADVNCVQFSLTLAPGVMAINFFVPDGCGASPSGSLFYQLDCGPLTSVGTPLCVEGPGPHIITFCKPGANENCYSIQSITEPDVGDDILVTDACSDILTATGLELSTITWTSVSPGTPGEYDAYLDCTSGCDTVTVIPDADAPPSISYQVCGVPIGGCDESPFCDTITVNYVTSLAVNISPENPTICYGEAGVELTATPSGGLAPYTYLWSTGATTSSMFATGPGTYTVSVEDSTGCVAAMDSVVVTEYLVPIVADAGPDITVCADPLPTVTLEGETTGSPTGIWSNGTGTFSPGPTDLNANYTPSAMEIEGGFAELILTTTDNGDCPGDSDTMFIYLKQFETMVSKTITDVDCAGSATGAVDITASGGAVPLSYVWDSGPTTEDISDLTIGTYKVVMTDTNGCVDSVSSVVNEPPPLSASSVPQDASCFGLNDASIDLTIAGGTPAYSFVWSGGEITEDISGLFAGTYDVTVTDANGCTIDLSATVNQPPEITMSAEVTNPGCADASDGQIDVIVSGGTGGYSYLWSDGATTEDRTGMSAGNYGLHIEDDNECPDSLTASLEDPVEFTAGDDGTAEICNGEDEQIDLDSLLSATTEGSWSEVTSSGTFNATTGVLDVSGLAPGDYIFNYDIPPTTPCTDSVAVFTVTVHPIPEINFVADTLSGCPPFEVNFTNTTTPDGVECGWDFGDGSGAVGCSAIQQHIYDYSGTYDVSLEVVTAEGCHNYLELESYITVVDPPIAEFMYSPGIPTVDFPEVQFDNLSEGADSYLWSFGDGSPNTTVTNPDHVYPVTPNAEYTVTLIASNYIGCKDTAKKIIKVEDVIIFFVPNSFTPDGDEFNNEFKPVMTAGYDIYDYHLTIFDRWGEIIFESYNADYGWDGTYGNQGLVQDGVYVWQIEFGETMSDKRHQRTGHVSVLR